MGIATESLPANYYSERYIYIYMGGLLDTRAAHERA